MMNFYCACKSLAKDNLKHRPDIEEKLTFAIIPLHNRDVSNLDALLVFAEECKEMEKMLLENNGNTAHHIPGPLPLREFVSI